MTLVPVDPKNETSVVMLLERVHEWLSTAVERSDATEIATVKAQIATAAEATKQLNLSKEIQLDAQEMVRRAEYALGKAIRKGQAEGTIAKRGDIGAAYPDATRSSRGDDLVRPASLIPHTAERNAIYALADAGDKAFEDALAEAKDEGSASRASVVRKVTQGTLPNSRDARAEVIEDLAGQGYSSKQMADRVGVTDARVREIARAYSIEIPADAVIGKQTRRMDHTASVESAVTELENWAGSLKYIDLTQVDRSEADEWVASLNSSLTELRRFIKQIKETTHV